MLSSCAIQTNEPPPSPPVDTETPVAPSIDPAKLRDWLELADVAISEGRITHPTDDSAYAFYQQILAIEPQQKDALHGLERIVENYVEQSIRALDRRQFAGARSMLARARLIMPNHPSIEPTESQIRLIMEADRKILKLGDAELKAETPELKRGLFNFAKNAAANCRFTIFARNDGQGRWIYQQLSKGRSGERLKAQIKLQSPVKVEKLCF